MCKAQECVDTLINILQDIKESYEFNLLNIDDVEKSLTDLGHEIELSKFNAVQGYKLAREEQNLRQERRRMKDENLTLIYLYNYFDAYTTIVSDLQRIRGDIKREEGFLKTRLYKPRIRTDLTIPTFGNIERVNTLQTRFKQAGIM